MPRSKSREARWQRVHQVIELSSQGLGPYEIARALNVDPHTVYLDMDLARRGYEFFMHTEQKVPHLMAKSNRALRKAWIELANADKDPTISPTQKVGLIGKVVETVGLQAKILGIDASKPAEIGPITIQIVTHTLTMPARLPVPQPPSPPPMLPELLRGEAHEESSNGSEPVDIEIVA